MSVNPEKARAGWPPVVVAGGYLTGVVLMRSLVRRGLTAYCVDCIPTQPAFKTVYGKAYLCPNPDKAPSEWLAFMLQLARDIGGKPVLISSADQFVTAIADHADELSTAFVFCRTSTATQALLATKQRQYSIADTHGLPVPRTRFVESAAEMEAFAAVTQYPCLVKPVHFRDWERIPAEHPLFGQKVAIAKTPRELAETYRLASQARPEMVLQEIIEGPDRAKLVYLSCYAQSGARIASCLVRQVRTLPVHFGSASVVEPVSDPETDQMCDAFLRRLKYVGICELELKRDSRDGQVKLIEANPRYSVTADAAPYAGVDIGWLHYLDLIGEPVVPATPDGRDFRHVFLLRDFATVRGHRREGLLTWREFFSAYRNPVAFFDFDWRDWRVTASTVAQLIRIIVGPPLRKIFPRRGN